MTKPQIWQKVADIRLSLLGNYWNKVYECDRNWLTEELETLQVILLEWIDMGNTADSVRALFDKLAQDVPKAEICNLLGFQSRTDLVVRYTTAQPSYDGFGTLELEVLHKSPRGLHWRKVAIAPEHLEWQESRYGSGLHPSHAQESWTHSLAR